MSPAAVHETKYVLQDRLAPMVRRWLEGRCRPDPQFPEGTVNSIYYDTPDWQLLDEKRNSDYLKAKVRVRWYADVRGHADDDPSFLEAKFKIGARREKVRIRTGLPGAELARIRLDSPDLRALPCLLGDDFPPLGGPLLPAFTISYTRSRFVDLATGARACIDHGIHVPAANRRMLPLANPFRLPTAVVELKGAATALPVAMAALVHLGCRKRSFSKYAACHSAMTRLRT